MIITSSTDPLIATVSTQIRYLTNLAITWFATARNVDQLANTKFTLLLQLFDQRERNALLVREKIVSVDRGCGPAFDRVINDVRKIIPDIPLLPTATLTVDQIFTVDGLTAELLSYLQEESAPLKLKAFNICVELFDLNGRRLNVNHWSMNWMMGERT